MKNKIICSCAIILSIAIAIFDCFVLFCLAEVKSACDLVFKSKGVYSESYSNFIDKKSFDDLSKDLIYSYYPELEKVNDYEIIEYNAKTGISPMSVLEFILEDTIYLKCDYVIKYKGKLYKSSDHEVLHNKFIYKLEDCHFKVYYDSNANWISDPFI